MNEAKISLTEFLGRLLESAIRNVLPRTNASTIIDILGLLPNRPVPVVGSDGWFRLPSKMKIIREVSALTNS